MKPYPYAIMGAIALGLWFCPSCDSRSDRSVVDRYDPKPASPIVPADPNDRTVPRAGGDFIDHTQRPVDPRVSDRPWTEDSGVAPGDRTYREPGATDPEVSILRQRLTASGDLTEGSSYPNYYGTDLDTAVKRFQASTRTGSMTCVRNV